MATTSCRWQTVARLKVLFEVNSLAAFVAPVPQVLMTLGMPPDDNAPAELAYVFHIEGAHDVMSYAARTNRQDQFVVTIAIHAEQAGQDDTTASQRAEQIFAFFENAVADNPKNLGAADGTGAVDGLKFAQITRVNGPNLVGTNTGYLAYIDFDLTCEAHLV